MNRKILKGSLSAVGILLLILDSKTALNGAAQGLEVCIRTLIPSLFPFFLLSILLTDSLTGIHWKCLAPIGKLLRLPEGSESLLLIGLLGGYPTGAQVVTQAWSSGSISTENARRMLGFCSNAGPAFLFGLISFQFSTPGTAWVLWAIHILSAMITGSLLPGGPDTPVFLKSKHELTVNEAFTGSLRVMAAVCGWVILFRVVLEFCNRWFFWALCPEAQIILQMCTELASGCISLSTIHNETLRLLVCSCGLALGGFCVFMQTVSVTGSLGLGSYLPGKLLQVLISAGLSCLYIGVSQRNVSALVIAAAVTCLILLPVLLRKRKNNCRNHCKAVV